LVSAKRRIREEGLVVELGSFERVPVRDIWAIEAAFTNWLAEPEHLLLLGETIGMELQLEAVEKQVGDFFADILCKETTGERYILIENQLGETDHSHLGQTITYAAGLDALAIVWIARHFRQEHRAALDWLNSNTDTSLGFFGLEIELWRIDHSPAAPRFNVVSSPNEWVGTVEAAGRKLSPTQEAQLAFWMEFKEYMEENSTVQSGTVGPYSYMNHPIGKPGFQLTSVLSTYNSVSQSQSSGELRVDFYIKTADAKAKYAALEVRKDELQAQISAGGGEELHWYSKEDVQACRIFVRKDAQVTLRSDWPNQREWLRSRLELLDRVFRPVIAGL
jgi:hypothetical protein